MVTNVEGKMMFIGEYQVKMDYNIKKVVEFPTQIIVLVYDKIIIPNNVISYDKTGKRLWVINDILKIKKPTGNVDICMTKEKYLDVYSSLDILFRVDVDEKKLIEKIYLR